jgi:hypothetical protein
MFWLRTADGNAVLGGTAWQQSHHSQMCGCITIMPWFDDGYMWQQAQHQPDVHLHFHVGHDTYALLRLEAESSAVL